MFNYFLKKIYAAGSLIEEKMQYAHTAEFIYCLLFGTSVRDG